MEPLTFSWRLVVLLAIIRGALSPSLAGSDRAADMPAPYKPEAIYKGFTRTSEYIAMRDGVRIAVDLYLPKDLQATDHIPTILHQTRYWRSMEFHPPASLLADGVREAGRIGKIRERFLLAGYAWVDVDTRGSGASFGIRAWDYSPDEILDADEIANWILNHTWSNGAIGTAGASYSGSAAEFSLLNKHPAIRACAPILCEWDQYQDILCPGGIPLDWYFKDWGALTRTLDANRLPPSKDPRQKYIIGVRPVDADKDRSLLLAAVRDHQNNYDFSSLRNIVFRDDFPIKIEADMPAAKRKALERSFDYLKGRLGPDFTKHGLDLVSTHAYASDINDSKTAIYSLSGWLDGPYARSATRRFTGLTNSNNKLIIGPWDHGLQNISPSEGPKPSEFDHAGELLKFFDFHLKGIDNGLSKDKRVHYFTMVEDRWKGIDSWPPPHSPWVLYFHPGSKLDSVKPLLDGAPTVHISDLQAGTGTDTRWNSLTIGPIKKPYSDREMRDQSLLCFTTSPLEHDVEVTGHPVVSINLESDSTDLTIFAYLEDVGEANTVVYVTEGMLRAIHRSAYGEDACHVPLRSYMRKEMRPLVPGKPVDLAFDLIPTSYLFRKGHSIRIALALSDVDHFKRIPDKGTVKISLYHGRSFVRLPIIKPEIR